MALDLHLSVFGEEIVSRTLLRFADNVEDARPAFSRIMRLLEEAAREQFATEGSAGGEPWAPLAESTLRSKPPGKGILENSGRLLNSLVAGGVAGSGDAVRFLGTQELRWGTNVEYAAFHQHGTSRMPRRRVVKLPELVKRQAVRELQKVAMRGVK
jgi:phage gpG-like protein